MIFGTDWPGVPGLKANAQAIADLGLEQGTLEGILNKNARRVYKLGGGEVSLGKFSQDNSKETDII